MQRSFALRILGSAALAAAIAVTSFSLGRASESAKFDATFWAGLSDDARLRFVQGVTDGASLGFVQGYIDGANAAFAKADEDMGIIDQTKDVIPMPQLVEATRKRLETQKVQVMRDMLSLKTTPPVFADTFQTYIDSVSAYYQRNPAKASDSPAAIMMHWSQK
ncbi:MAG: hypothetical protein ACRENA_02625 [Vulcanimicrobiaceae bacterium]